MQQINQQLHGIINQKIRQTIADTPAVCESLLDWHNDTTTLFEVLASDSVTISKVDTIASHIPWLVAVYRPLSACHWIVQILRNYQ